MMASACVCVQLDVEEKHCRTRPTNIEAITFFICFVTAYSALHMCETLEFRLKFYLPGICLGGSQSAVAARFLGVVPYGVGLSSQIEVRKLVLNPEFEKSKRSLAVHQPETFLVTTEVEETSAVGSNGAKVCGAAEKIAPKLARPFCYNTAYQHPSNLIFYGFRPLVFNQGTVSRQKNQAAFLRPRRFMVPAVALAASKITVLLSG